MKLSYFLLLFTYSLIPAFAQVPKISIVEHFTNTSCSVCAANNPGIYNTLNMHKDVLHISYHPSSPYPDDIFNVLNKAENDARTKYYGLYGSTPKTALNGKAVAYSSLASAIASAKDDSSNFQIHIRQMKKGSDSFVVRVCIRKLGMDTLSSARLFVAATEKSISKTGKNGETVHYNVFRKEISPKGNAGIITLPLQLNDSSVYLYTYAIESDWNSSEIVSLAILQSESTRNVIQSAISSQQETSGIFPNNAVVNSPYLYPNPSKGLFNSSSDIESVRFFNLDGKMILEFREVKKGTELSVSHLNKGLYYVELIENGIRTAETVLIE